MMTLLSGNSAQISDAITQETKQKEQKQLFFFLLIFRPKSMFVGNTFRPKNQKKEK